MKVTKLWIGYFMTISCHFFTNYINNFRKTEDLRVILVCPIYKNINWIKFCKKKKIKFTTHLRPFLAIFQPTTKKSFTKLKFRRSFWGALCIYILIESKVIAKKHFFHAWKCIISGLFCQSEFWDLLRKTCLMISKWLFFQNSLELLWDK